MVYILYKGKRKEGEKIEQENGSRGGEEEEEKEGGGEERKQERRRKRIFHQTKAVQQSLEFLVLHARNQAPAGV